MSAQTDYRHAYDNRHRCGVLGAQDIEMMSREVDRLRSQVQRLGSREFARSVTDSFVANFLDAQAEGGVVTFPINVLLSEIRHAVRFAIEDATGSVPA